MTILKHFDLLNLRRVILLLLSAGMFILIAGYNVYWDGSKYHTGYYLLFLLVGLGYLFTDLKTSVKILKEPLGLAAMIFLVTIAIAQLYPGIEAKPLSDLEKIALILLSLVIIGQFVSENTALFSRIMMVAVVAVALVAIHHVYMFYLVENHPVSERMTGYFIPENPLYLAQSFGFFFIAAVYLAVGNHRNPLVLVLMASSAGILAFAAVATQSRSFVVASIAAIIIPFFGRGRTTLVFTLAFLLVLFAGIFYLNPAILERTEFYRPQIWKQALEIISERPFLGWGGNYYPEIRVERLPQVLRDTHNILLTIWLKYGVLSFVTLTALLCYAVILAFRDTCDSILRLGGALLIFGVTMLFFEGHNIISKPNSTWHMVWIPLGIIMGGVHAQYRGSCTGNETA